MDHDRIAALDRSLPFYTWYARSPHTERAGQPGVIDLLFGNPHDMPIPEYVEVVRRHAEPKDPSWYVYMLDHEPATAVVARDLSAHTGLAWRPEDIAMTTGGWGAIAIAMRMVTEPGDEVIYYDPPWFFYDILVRGAEAVPVVLTLDPPRFSPDPQRLADAISPRIPDPAPLRQAATLTRFVNGFGFPNNVLQRALPDFAHLCVDLDGIKRRRDRLVPVLAERGFEPTTPEGTFYIMARSPDPDDEA